MKGFAICIFAALVVAVFVNIGFCIGPRPHDVESYMQTEKYKAQERAHLSKWEVVR